ncbi:hypothetical protein [Acidovorax radicis]|jgi:hypothetical protein|uniref:hypothetical protein n=1 Tax=Acidovorax radicis TaxID=758826 RepID=UPI001CF94435|nr:hypothetical protein [Acidovorax radicis]UCV00116.1 hypothetical protein KI609_04845 [Acidovorax radicis]
MNQRTTSPQAAAPKVAMSGAERQRRHREKRKAELQALRTGGSLALPLPVPALRDDAQALRTQLDATRKRCETQAAELTALRAKHEPLAVRLQVLRTVLRALIGKLSPATRHVARSHLQETGFIEWLDAD